MFWILTKLFKCVVITVSYRICWYISDKWSNHSKTVLYHLWMIIGYTFIYILYINPQQDERSNWRQSMTLRRSSALLVFFCVWVCMHVHVAQLKGNWKIYSLVILYFTHFCARDPQAMWPLVKLVTLWNYFVKQTIVICNISNVYQLYIL